jgi:hypothetical protein
MMEVLRLEMTVAAGRELLDEFGPQRSLDTLGVRAS